MSSHRPPLALVGLLYVCEGLPFGFQAIALPVYLRSAGVSLAGIGFLGALSVPWLLKPLWAPWIDAHGSRRSWILPLQALLALTAGLAAWTPPETALTALLALVFLMNLFAATLDIAVDGLAVDLLRAEELGHGNALQVVGYKVGMLGGGGLLVWASAWIGFSGLFLAMAGFLLAALVVCAVALPGASSPIERPRGAAGVTRALLTALRAPGALAVLVLAATYKLGETFQDVLWKPYLVDAGFTPAELGALLGMASLGASLLGSLAGGLWASRVGPRRALGHAALLRIPPLVLMALLVAARDAGAEVPRWALEGATIVESLLAGALTPAMFAFMMARVDPRIGAAHYTLLAAVEVGGKALAGLPSGLLAEAWGYAAVLGLGAVLSVGFSALLPLLAPLTPSEPRGRYPSDRLS